MADREIENLHSKQTAVGYNSKLKFCQSGVKQARFQNLKEKGNEFFCIKVAPFKVPLKSGYYNASFYFLGILGVMTSHYFA